ncbi:MAG TPA: DivIVA domain-containing protein [Acidimicrobiales bacterium]|nr:DivIVA domain-containing protein [Acidimicrobiales bacterium]
MSQPPELLDPQALARVDFALVRRGYSTEQVDSVLQQAAAALAAAQRRMGELGDEVESLRDQAPPPDVSELDDNELMLRLGEKTARVLEAARESAAELEQKSQERATATVNRAKEEALRIRSEAERVMRETRARIEALEKETDRKVRELRLAAEADADRLRSQAEEVLRSARADAHATEQEAAARAEALTQEATENAARARAKVEALLTSTRTQVEANRASAEEEAARVRQEAVDEVAAKLADADRLAEAKLAEAQARAERITSQAEAAYEERVALGRERGRELIAEAEIKRAEVLRQLARTRQRAHLNIEQLRVGRERLMTAYEVARATIEQATGELERSGPEAKALAERLAARVGDDESRSLAELEAEFELERLEDLRVLGDDDPAAKAPTRPGEQREAGERPEQPATAEEAPAEVSASAGVFDMEAVEEEAEVEAQVLAQAAEPEPAPVAVSTAEDDDEVIDLTDDATQPLAAEERAPTTG